MLSDMAAILGELTVHNAGKDYCLRLTMRSIAQLQDEYGQGLMPLLGMKDGELPHFGICLRLVELALKKHHPDAGPELADDILTADIGVVGRLIAAAFPDMEGNTGGKPEAVGA